MLKNKLPISGTVWVKVSQGAELPYVFTSSQGPELLWRHVHARLQH